MLDFYEIKSSEQAKVMSHQLRLQIISVLRDLAPRTAKQIADYLEMPASKVHYHVRELEKVGLLELVETREKGGVIEKYYLPIAKEFRIHLSEDDLTNESGKSANYQLTKVLINDYRDSFLRVIAQADQMELQGEQKELGPSIYMGNLSLTKEEILELNEELKAVLDNWKEKGIQSKRSNQERYPYKIFLSLYPTNPKKSIGGSAEIN